MITIYKKKPRGREIVALNDIYFNKTTVEKLDDKANAIIDKIDQSKIISKYTVSSKFNGTVLNIDKLSTGCKTALNIMYNPDVIFDICECGDNALDVIYSLPLGNVYCDYPFISFDMEKVNVYDDNKVIPMRN